MLHFITWISWPPLFGLVFLSPGPINQPTGASRGSLQKVRARQDVTSRSEGNVKSRPLELLHQQAAGKLFKNISSALE